MNKLHYEDMYMMTAAMIMVNQGNSIIVLGSDFA